MFVQFVFHIILLVTWPIYPLASAESEYSGSTIAQPDCDSKCGDVDIPYPFGIKKNITKCYADEWFEIECRDITSTTTEDFRQRPYLKSLSLEVKDINYMSGTVDIVNPVFRMNCGGKNDAGQGQVINLTGSPFVYSQEHNKFVAIGCNNIALLNLNGSQVSGCLSICDDNTKVDDYSLRSDGCYGKYCCETSLPNYLSEYNATFQPLSNNYHVTNNCSYALIVRKLSLYRPYYDGNDYETHPSSGSADYDGIASLKNLNYVDAVLEWEILNSIHLEHSNYADCEPTNVTSSQKGGSGRRCLCRHGYDGNPYIAGGCGETPGYYKRNNRAKSAITGVVSSLGSILLLLGLWQSLKVVRKKMVKKRKEKFFRQNGGLLLKQRLSSSAVNVDRNKIFSLKDSEKATDHFNMNRVLGKGGQGTVYKGMVVDGKIVAVKKFKVQGKVEEFINEFVILSQINHRNVVKLLGCCLETEIPLLVYEFIPNGTLFEYLHDQNEDLPMTWDMLLRIATEVAGALFYLHSAASQPIYHRDVKSTNILLDEKYKAKVADFGTSRMISIEATHLTTVVQGTFGYLDPEYFHTSQFTEKSDVYSFGVVLVELLTGQKPISALRPEEAKSLSSYFVLCMEEDRLYDIIDERVKGEGEKKHIIAVANLANKCLLLNGKKRPTMKEVTMELERIRGLDGKFDSQQSHEEIELAKVEDYEPWAAYSASYTGPTLNNKPSALEVMPILTR